MSDETPPGQSQMEKPKPARDWRSFAKEYVIVVLGVATALAAQQAAESWNNRSRAAEARASIRSEIAFNLGEMDARHATESCMTKRLDEIDGVISAASTGKLPQEPLWIGTPAFRTMQDAKYKAAMQSGAVSLFGDDEQAIYSDLYSKFDTHNRESNTERMAWGDLRTLERHPPPTAALDALWRSAVQQARTPRSLIVLTRQIAITGAARIGIMPAPQPSRVRSVCVPLHTPRDEALKQMDSRFNVPVP